jgi:hypothetical protein
MPRSSFGRQEQAREGVAEVADPNGGKASPPGGDAGRTPPGTVFPVSSVMLDRIVRDAFDGFEDSAPGSGAAAEE